MNDRPIWDERHRDAPPNRVAIPIALVGQEELVPSTGLALDLACGRGGTAVWAALRGLSVVAIDASPVAVGATRRLADAHGVGGTVDARIHDLTDGIPAGLDGFDLVICQRFLDPELWPEIVRRCAPGGMVAITVLSSAGSDGHGRFRAGPSALLDAFEPLDVHIVDHVEGDGEASLVATVGG